MKEKHLIVRIHLQNRTEDANKVQQLLTDFGCNIRTRVGLHEVDANYCSTGGIILLELVGDDAVCEELISKLGGMDRVDVQCMTFEHYD